MNIQTYPTRNYCHHCIWIEEKAWKWDGNERKIKKPVFKIKPSKDFLGVSVFDSHAFFENTFICVLGYKGEQSAFYHQFNRLGSLLRGAVIFIEELHLRFGVEKVKLLINSNLNVKKHGKKEHPHAIITLPNLTEAQYKKIFGTNIIKGAKKVPSEPYPDDTVVRLTKEQSSELIRAGDSPPLGAYKMIISILKEKLGKFDILDNFYLFMTFECSRKGEQLCGVVNSLISTDKKQGEEQDEKTDV